MKKVLCYVLAIILTGGSMMSLVNAKVTTKVELLASTALTSINGTANEELKKANELACEELRIANAGSNEIFRAANAASNESLKIANASANEEFRKANAVAAQTLREANVQASAEQRLANKVAYDAQLVANKAAYQEQLSANKRDYQEQLKANNLEYQALVYENELAYQEQLKANQLAYDEQVKDNEVIDPVEIPVDEIIEEPIIEEPIIEEPIIEEPEVVEEVDLPNGTVSVINFGAKGDGITDDTKAIQAAIDSLGEAGGKVLFPKGIYVCNNIKLKSNISVVGEGWESVLQQKSGLTGYQALLGVNQGGAGTSQPDGNTSLTGTIKNVTIRNIKLKGTVKSEGFKEWVHLLTLNSCSNILVDNVRFEGFRGDGVFIGVESRTERHASDITIRNSEFDGINKDNRNAISVIEGTDILIEDNLFERCTRSDMPGAIDIEPNHNESATWTIIKNITIKNNKFNDLGNSGIVYYNPNEQKEMLKQPSSNIIIEGNSINKAYIGIELVQAYTIMNDSVAKQNIYVSNNTIKNSFSPVYARGIRGLNIVKNVFEDCETGLGLGIGGKKVLDVNVESNSFVRLGFKDEAGLLISDASRVKVINNLFVDCGTKSGEWNEGFAICFYKGSSDYISIQGNTTTSPNDITTHFIYVSPTHTLKPLTNTISNNTSGGFVIMKIIQ